MRRLPAKRLLTVAILGAVLISASVASQEPQERFQDVRESECWDCHFDWPAGALRQFVNIVPPPAIEAGIGSTFEYAVEVQNSWLSEHRYFQPSLDLTNAPSLAVESDLEDVLGIVTTGEIPIDYTSSPGDETPLDRQDTQVSVNVPVSTTDLVITLLPGNTDALLGPDVGMDIYPVTNDPARRQPTYTVDEAGNGASERLQLTLPGEIAAGGYGDWVIEVFTRPIDQEKTTGSPAGTRDIPFSITVDAYRNSSLDRVFAQESTERVGPGFSTVFSWKVQVLGEPQEGEKLSIVVNHTTYYNHGDPEYPDEADINAATTVDVLARDGKVILQSTGVLVNPDVVLGLSMARIGEAVGYLSAFLIVASVYSGGMFGKVSRRHLNGLFGSAKRRVAFHNILSYGLTAAAIAHLVLFLVEEKFWWTNGLIFGGAAMLTMLGLGVTGALQVPIIRRWNYGTWRWTHLSLAILTIVLTIVHLLLEGDNFTAVREFVGYSDPFEPSIRT